VSRFLTARQHN